MSYNAGLPPWRRSDNFGLAAHERIVGALNRLTLLSPMGRMQIHGSTTGTGIQPDETRAGQRIPLLRLSSLDTGPGEYLMTKLDKPAGPISSTSDGFGSADIGSGTVTIRGWNLLERDAPSGQHMLTVGGAFYPQEFGGISLLGTDASGKEVWVFEGFQFEECDPPGNTPLL